MWQPLATKPTLLNAILVVISYEFSGTSPMAWQVFCQSSPSMWKVKGKRPGLIHACNPKCLPLLLWYQTNSIVFAGWMDGFCGHLIICKVLHPSSYSIFQKALEHKGKLITSSAFNRGWYAGHTQAAVGSFLLRIIMGSHSLLGTQLNSAHCCRPRHTSLLKSQESVLLSSFISYKIHQIVKNSVIIRPKKRKKKSWCWAIQPGIIVTFLFFPFFVSFRSPLSMVWSIHLPPQNESTS